MPPERPTRLVSLDVFRGLTIAGMLVVNTPGHGSSTFQALKHARWNGCTPTDWIMPFFLFIVGVSMSLSFAARRARGEDDGAMLRHAARRSAILFALGLLYNWFPFVGWSLDTCRIPGVLQRIAFCYLLVAVIALRLTIRAQIVTGAALLIGYFAAMTMAPVPGRGVVALTYENANANLAAWLDQLLMGRHLQYGKRDWDANGLLASLPAAATMLIGAFVGRWLQGGGHANHDKNRLGRLAFAGAALAFAGWIWGGLPGWSGVLSLGEPRLRAAWVFAINKPIWTSSYVLFTGGLACVLLAGCIWVIDVRRFVALNMPFVVLGANPILAYILASFHDRVMRLVKLGDEGFRRSLHALVFDGVFASWLPGRALASLAYALAFTAFWTLVMCVFYRKRIFLKV